MGVSVSVIAASTSAGSTPPGPDSMVARMMSKVVRIMSWLTRRGRPGPSSQRSRVSRAASSMAGARAESLPGWKAGAAARRCQRQCAPSAVSRPSPRARPSTRLFSGVLGKMSDRRTRISWISSGSSTYQRCGRPPTPLTSAASKTSGGKASRGLRITARTVAKSSRRELVTGEWRRGAPEGGVLEGVGRPAGALGAGAGRKTGIARPTAGFRQSFHFDPSLQMGASRWGEVSRRQR